MASDQTQEEEFLFHEFDEEHAAFSAGAYIRLAVALALDESECMDQRISGQLPEPVPIEDREWPRLTTVMEDLGLARLNKASVFILRTQRVLEILVERQK